MNIEKANSTALPEILRKFNYSELEQNNEVIIQTVCEYLQANSESHNREDALRWINNMCGNTHLIQSINVPETYEPKLIQQKTRFIPKPVKRPVLTNYLQKRGIPSFYARNIVEEIKVRSLSTGLATYCLGVKNEKGGYDFRASEFKGMLRPLDITFVRGEIPKPSSIHIFRTFIDYLTVLAVLRKTALQGDSIILNSMRMLGNATPYIKHYVYKTLYSYMSNDEIGKQAIKSISNFCTYEKSLIHRPMNNIYIAFKDINQWHMRNLRLQ